MAKKGVKSVKRKPSSRGKPIERRPATVKTAGELARWCGVSERTVHTWQKQDGFPVEPDGSFSPWNVAQWRILRERIDGDLAGEPGMEGQNSPSLEKWRNERYLMARMERLERAKELVSRAVVAAQFEIVASYLRAFGEQLQAEDLSEVYNEWDRHLEELDASIEEFFEREFGKSWATAKGTYRVMVEKIKDTKRGSCLKTDLESTDGQALLNHH